MQITGFSVSCALFAVSVASFFVSPLDFDKIGVGLIATLIFRGACSILGLYLVFSCLLFVIKSSVSESVKNCSLAFASIIALLFTLEGVFMFVPQSHAVGHTLASRIWFTYFWYPQNSFGYRDKEIDLVEVGKRKIIIVIGDSFVAGHGIKQIKDRFTDRLQEKLYPEYTVYNLGLNGNDTIKEYQDLEKFPVIPSALILSYFGNDIDKRAELSGKYFDGFTPYSDISNFYRFVVKRSYFINFIYWQFPRVDVKPYVEYLQESYADENIIQKHYSDIEKFILYSEKNGVDLVVVIFPFLREPEFSKFYTTKIKNMLQTKGVVTIDITDHIEQIDPEDRSVNAHDPHPSVTVHNLVADLLYHHFSSK